MIFPFLSLYPYIYYFLIHVFITLLQFFLNYFFMDTVIKTKELTHSHTMTPFDAPGKQAF